MNRGEQPSRVLSRAETDAINSILDEEEMRFGQFSSLSPELTELDAQCKQIWSNWESLPTSSSKAARINFNDENRSSQRLNNDPYDSHKTRASHFNNFDLDAPLNARNNGNNFRYNFDAPTAAASRNIDDILARQSVSPKQQKSDNFDSTFGVSSRPMPNLDDIAGYIPNKFSTPSYDAAAGKRANNFDFDYNEPKRNNVRAEIYENDVGSLKNELDSLMAKVRNASRSPTSTTSPRNNDFSVPTRDLPMYNKTPTNDFASQKFQSPRTTYSSPKTASLGIPQTDLTGTSKTFQPQTSGSVYRTNNNTLHDDSFAQNSFNANDDSFAEPVNISLKATNTASKTASVYASPPQPESLRLQQENVRLKAELLKAQKKIQSIEEENKNLILSLEKSEQLRKLYKEKIANYQKQFEQMQQK